MRKIKILFVLIAVISLCTAFGQDSLVVNGVSDRSTYTGSAWFYIPVQNGYAYYALLNEKPVEVGVTNRIDLMDYYELTVFRTNINTLQVTNLTIRFIVVATDRGSPEKGLVKWTPYPLVPSSFEEFKGSVLKILSPSSYPVGLPVPIIARIEEPDGNERRVNGFVSAKGFEGCDIKILRGHGSGFLPPQTTSSTLVYEPTVYDIKVTKNISIEPTSWITVSGTLSGSTKWNANSRIFISGNITIPPESTLTIEEGTVIKLNPLVNITNSGTMIINGTSENPVVFTSTNVVYPEKNAGAWGGFIMRGASSRLIAHYAIFAGGGGATSFSFSPGSSHRSEQPVFLLQSGAAAYLTNCAVINTAGQVGNGYQSDLTLDHCLIQRAITCGEYVGGTIIVNHSALIEFPVDDGVVNAAIADGDYDGIYFTEGTHILINSLFGFAKDDAIDSGSGGAGTVLVSNCWVEAALHEALAWSGEGRITWTYDSVLMNCGQGIEAGWSTGNNSPMCYAERLLSIQNSVGARFGDNYDWSYNGFLQISNSIIINNYRDVWGMNWADWTYRVNQMDIRSNYLTKPNTNHPNNFVWNPQTDGARLAHYMRSPVGVPVGIGFAVRSNKITALDLTNGIPIRLSTFTINPAAVKAVFETQERVLHEEEIVFAPGETLKEVSMSSLPPTNRLIRVCLINPSNCEITGVKEVWFIPSGEAGESPTDVLIQPDAVWKYLDDGSDQGTAWRYMNYNDSNWKSGAAELGFGDGDETTVINRYNANNQQIITYYFRHYFVVENPQDYSSVTVSLRRDDGGIVYINGIEVFRSNMPSGTNITASTFASGSASDDGNTWYSTNISPNLLVKGTNLCAVEIHQNNTTSSDVTFALQLIGNKPQPPIKLKINRFRNNAVLDWNAENTVLEFTDNLAHPWQTIFATPPFSIDFSGHQKYFRLRKI